MSTTTRPDIAAAPEALTLIDGHDAPLVRVSAAADPPATAHIRVGTDAEGTLACADARTFDVLLTSRGDAPAPWVTVADPERAAQRLVVAAERNPLASLTLTRLLRLNEGRRHGDALLIESFAYSTLLKGGEFGRWRRSHPPAERGANSRPPLRFDRTHDHVTLTLDRPEHGNPHTAALRDALSEALHIVALDPTAPTVTLRATGKAFSTGGALDEFGQAEDMAAACYTRWTRSAARALLDLGDRADAVVQGACIGAGIEIAAAASRLTARGYAWFQLPEIGMGLIPGAGGTVTVPRRIGRHRMLYLCLSGRRITASTASRWGLVDAVVAE
ncbi:MAG TPA: enoyl-CoA hydratase/isomerase family protein [Stellaceae bacterium]|nr:enoyl-CoA hydratase/isomerase family protein [Stellaceae bacterium]